MDRNFHDTEDISRLLYYYEYKRKSFNIIKKGLCYHFDQINEETIKLYLESMVLRGDHKPYLSE